MKKAWMRNLTVILSNGKQKLVFGENYLDGKVDLDIKVDGHKYMSSLKDNCSVKITNLTYYDVVRIIDGKFYDLEIKCGYKNIGSHTIFKGGILYISNSLGDRKSNTVIILGASNMVAKYGQQRLNLTLNSGINMYSAINFICKRAGIPNSNISTQFKKQFLNDVVNANSTIGSWLDSLTSSNSNIIVNSDNTTSGEFLIYDSSKSNARVITLTDKNIVLSGGYPQLTSDGLRLTILPTFGFMCGDVIKIDNSLIDISSTSNSLQNISKGYYLDEEGLYTIFEIDYSLSNRDSNFSYELTCRSRSLISNITGGLSNE